MIMALSSDHQLLQALDERLSPGLEVWQEPLRLSALGNDSELENSFFAHFDKEVFYTILDYLKSDGALTPEETALNINGLLPTCSLSGEDGFGMTIDFSTIFAEICLELPHDHTYQERMLSLALAFQTIPEPDAISPFAFYGCGWYSLRNIGVIGYSFNERFNYTVYDHGNMPDGYGGRREKAVHGPVEPLLQVDEGQVSKWVNLQAFSARLVTTKLYSISFAKFFIWAFRDSAMEEPCYDIDVLNCDIRASAMWILYVGNKYRNLIPGGELDDDDKRVLGVGSLYTGKAGFTVERWLFWKKRYLDLLDQFGDKLSEEATTAAKAAIAKISETEKAWDLDKH